MSLSIFNKQPNLIHSNPKIQNINKQISYNNNNNSSCKEQARMKKQVKIPTFNQYDTVSPATKLLEKRRKMYQIHEAFETEKEDFKHKELGYTEEEEKIKSKDKDFQLQMTKFCQYSQENQIKKTKALERMKQEEQIYASKQQTIRNLEKQIIQLSKNQKRHTKKANSLQIYQKFLEQVQKQFPDQYPEMTDILSRYQTLKKSNKDLIQSRQKMQTQFQTLKKKSLNEEKDLNRSILTISNQTKDLSRRIQDKMKQKNQIQTEVQSSNQDFSKKNLTLGKIFMAIDNLFFRCTENSFKLKHDFQQKSNQKKQFKATKKIQGQTTNVGGKNQSEITYEQKSKIASSKLKSIVSFMKDFKNIIDEYNAAKKG